MKRTTSLFRQFFCHHVIEKKTCTKCGKTGFGMPVFLNPPPVPLKSMKRLSVIDHSDLYMPGKGGFTSGPRCDEKPNLKEYEFTPVNPVHSD